MAKPWPAWRLAPAGSPNIDADRYDFIGTRPRRSTGRGRCRRQRRRRRGRRYRSSDPAPARQAARSAGERIARVTAPVNNRMVGMAREGTTLIPKRSASNSGERVRKFRFRSRCSRHSRRGRRRAERLIFFSSKRPSMLAMDSSTVIGIGMPFHRAPGKVLHQLASLIWRVSSIRSDGTRHFWRSIPAGFRSFAVQPRRGYRRYA